MENSNFMWSSGEMNLTKFLFWHKKNNNDSTMQMALDSYPNLKFYFSLTGESSPPHPPPSPSPPPPPPHSIIHGPYLRHETAQNTQYMYMHKSSTKTASLYIWMPSKKYVGSKEVITWRYAPPPPLYTHFGLNYQLELGYHLKVAKISSDSSVLNLATLGFKLYKYLCGVASQCHNKITKHSISSCTTYYLLMISLQAESIIALQCPMYTAAVLSRLSIEAAAEG